MQAALHLLQKLGRPRILVLGDLMLDCYTGGNAQRVSPEAPVLVLQADTREVRPGGAASVASLLRGLEAEVSVVGVLGEDPEGKTLRKLLAEQGIEQELVLLDPGRPTTTKERFVGRAAARHPHQILRVDRETCDPLGAELEGCVAQGVAARLPECQAVLVSDYSKGVCTPRLIHGVIGAATQSGVPVLVDPARVADYSRYQGATILMPNRAEAAQATGRSAIRTVEEARATGRQLHETCRVQAVVVKLDSDGMVLVSADGTEEHIPTRARQVHDVTGAGDMVLAMLGLCQASGVPLRDGVRLANVAAGLEVERLGVATVSRAELCAELARQGEPRAGKLVTVDEMAALAEGYRLAGRTIVFTNGCFDLLHVGHASYLQEAAELGDSLVVAVNSDRSVRALKGPDRPIIPEQDRAALVAALETVDHVLIFDEDTPYELVRRIRPDVLVKGGGYRPEEIIGRDVVAAYGGQVRVTSRIPDVSTTAILAAVRAGQAAPAEPVSV